MFAALDKNAGKQSDRSHEQMGMMDYALSSTLDSSHHAVKTLLNSEEQNRIKTDAEQVAQGNLPDGKQLAAACAAAQKPTDGSEELEKVLDAASSGKGMNDNANEPEPIESKKV